MKAISTVFAAISVAVATTCPGIHDPQSPFSSSLQTIANINVTSTLGTAGSIIPPSIAQCIGALSASSLLALVMETLGTPSCTNTLIWAQKTLPAILSSNSIENSTFLDTLQAIDDTSISDQCGPMKDVVPCLDSTLLPKLSALLSRHECCYPMLNDIEALSGEKFHDALIDLLRFGVDIVCSTQSPGFNEAASQTCGYSLLKSFLSQTNGNLMLTVLLALHSMQIPNNQAVQAITGTEFKSTMNEVVQVFTPPLVPSACTKPVDALFQWFRRIPMVVKPYNGILLSKLFEDEQCQPAGQLLQWFVVVFPGLLDSDMLTTLQTFLTDESICFHLANGYSASPVLNTPLTLFSTNFPPSARSNFIPVPITTQTPIRPTTIEPEKSSSVSALSYCTFLILGMLMILFE